MTWTVWLSLLGACFIISFTPGAGAINTMSTSIRQGWRHSVWAILGQVLGLITHLIIVALGVGLLVSKSPMLFDAIRYAGAAYLVFLGIRLILAKPEPDEAGVELKPRTKESRWTLIRRGYWVNILNPKSIVFFLAFVPQFIRLDEPQLPQYLILLATVVVVDICVMWFFFALLARPFQKFTNTERGQRILNTIFGGLFLAMAVLLLFLH